MLALSPAAQSRSGPFSPMTPLPITIHTPTVPAAAAAAAVTPSVMVTGAVASGVGSVPATPTADGDAAVLAPRTPKSGLLARLVGRG